MINVTIWNEFVHEKTEQKVAEIYPKGIHGCIAEFLGENGDFSIRTATLEEPEHGLTAEVLDNTDVLLWWGHLAHGKVSDDIVNRVHKRVLAGMGIIFLHSGHHSKIFCKLMGTTGSLSWREGDRERLWNILPSHPIAEGVGEYIELDEEMYGEPFDIPQPDEIVFLGWFAGGEVMRSGCCWSRGLGRIFYFQPGHEMNPTYHIPQVQKIITNSVRWAAPLKKWATPECINAQISPEQKRSENI